MTVTQAKPNTNVYIDGFNLYYRIKNTRYKWLDLRLLCENYFPNLQIDNIKYFTAIVKPTPDDPTKPFRQHNYIQAIQNHSRVQVILGSFLKTKKTFPVLDFDERGNRQHIIVEILKYFKMRLPIAKTNDSQYLLVSKFEEKGSDVNLATHLVNDAHLGNYDAAIVISNDSDLAEAIRIVERQISRPIFLLSPSKRTCKKLLRACDNSRIKRIRGRALGVSQLPDIIQLTRGEIKKPVEWN